MNLQENFIYDTYRNLKASAIPFEMIAASVHDESDDLNVTKEIFSDLPMKWTSCYNLSRRSEFLVSFPC